MRPFVVERTHAETNTLWARCEVEDRYGRHPGDIDFDPRGEAQWHPVEYRGRVLVTLVDEVGRPIEAVKSETADAANVNRF
jgi:hypothetical protein